MVQMNGQNEDVAGMRLMDYLIQHNYRKDAIAVECNEQIIVKSRYEEYVLRDGDVGEIVSFVGGW